MDTETPDADVLGCVVALLLLPVTMILNGFVLCKLWIWFIMPQFYLEALTMPNALGFSLLAALLTHQRVPQDEKKGAIWEAIAMAILLPLFVLAVGQIIHLF